MIMTSQTSTSVDGHIAQSLTSKFLRNHKQLMALWIFRMKSLVDSEVLVLHGKDLLALDVGEDCITHDQQPRHILIPQPAHCMQRTKTLQSTDPSCR